MQSILNFNIQLDPRAGGWLECRSGFGSIVIAYSETRCCGGGRICQVRIRDRKRAEPSALVRIGSVAGRELFADRRIVGRLPYRLPITVRGVGPFQALSLDLEGEEWARLLYD